ncbi:SNF1-related protein kinase regulatory subunit beta-2-like isoform X2 [Punica granatum]|nr:SNF1-related protein kinase regulatory subunit beta-2-like isoform X2 [Punica granatum]XP_031406977.1 SNF1-related protein kinase regulatory subunit beta-2-like isoform X2 [Punica granatum]XP_031406978.1 SNF1-related protein kinase regulatory subunit beta-2-like isoform X2 [Punica granatum]PKI76865.1 hypothetical protein CRG98_002851 [Punica granatum]
MGNVSGRRDEEGTSGEYGAEERSEQRAMEFAQSGSSHRHEPLVQSSPLGPWEFRSNLFHAPMRTDAEFVHSEKRVPVMITWSHGGEKVAISGSWNNWELIELMERSGKDFVIMKVLPSGIYHFRFIVDGHLRYDPDLPCDFDDPGGVYNIMDVKEYAAETQESIADFELPPSPDATYSNNLLTDTDFSRPPPDLPPQLQRTPLNETAFGESYHQSLSRTQLPVLNHLYVKKWDLGEPIALGSTNWFLEKHVTVILYKPSWRHR